MKQKYIIPILLSLLATGVAGCSKDIAGSAIDPSLSERETLVKMGGGINEEAVLQGRVVVKFKDDSFKSLVLNNSADAVLMSSLPTALQSTLAGVGAYSVTPLFPDYPEHRERREKYGLNRWMVISFDQKNSVNSVLSSLSALPDFEVVEPRYRTEIIDNGPAVPMTLAESDLNAVDRPENTPFDDPYLPDQWHYNNRGQASGNGAIEGADINLFEAWEKQTGKRDVIVCVVDGGIDFAHEDLAAHLDHENSRNFVYDMATFKMKWELGEDIYVDGYGHATHVAGTVSAVTGNGLGVAGVAGGDGSPDSGVKLINAQCYGLLYDNGSGNVQQETGNNEAAIVWGADHGAVISQNSWGYTENAKLKEVPESIKAAIDYFIREAGMDDNGKQLPGSPMAGGVVIFAAGNEGLEYDSYPAAYEPCVAVTAMGWNFKKTGYSNYGDWADVMAPGGNSGSTGVLSTMPQSIAIGTEGYELTATRYGYMQGTSMACPHVSGVAALIVSEFGGEGYTAEECRAKLVSALSPYGIYTMNPEPIYAGKIGKGYIDAGAALLTDPGVGPDKPSVTVSDLSFYTAQAAFKAVANPNSGRPNDLANHYKIFISDKAGATVEDLLATEPVATIFGDNQPVGYDFTKVLVNLKDNTEYSIIVVSYDTFNNGTPSDIVTFKTPLNNPPTITSGLPEEASTLLSVDELNFLFPVADKDGHTWSHSISGDTKGVSVVREGESLKVDVQPVQTEEGEYSFVINLTDEYGKSQAYTIAYRFVKYFPPRLNSNLADITIGVNNGPSRIPLDGKIDYVDVLPLTVNAASANDSYFEAAIEGNELVLTPKMKGRANVTLKANDGKNEASKSVKVTVVDDTDATVMLVYPMPATTKINALFNPTVLNAEVKITSLRGEVLIEESVPASPSHLATIDISSLSAGTYIMVVRTSGNAVYKTNFIKI